MLDRRPISPWVCLLLWPVFMWLHWTGWTRDPSETLTVSCVSPQVTASGGTRTQWTCSVSPRKVFHVLSQSQMSLISLKPRSFFLLGIKFMRVCVYMHVSVHTHACVHRVVCVQVKGQLAGDGLFFPPCGLLRSSALVVWWPVKK